MQYQHADPNRCCSLEGIKWRCYQVLRNASNLPAVLLLLSGAFWMACTLAGALPFRRLMKSAKGSWQQKAWPLCYYKQMSNANKHLRRCKAQILNASKIAKIGCLQFRSFGDHCTCHWEKHGYDYDTVPMRKVNNSTVATMPEFFVHLRVPCKGVLRIFVILVTPVTDPSQITFNLEPRL